MTDFTPPTPPLNGPNGQRSALPWEGSKGIGTQPGAPKVTGPLSDAANAHALQQVKGRIHRRLLERLNLSNLDRLDRQQVVDAIRKVVQDQITQESVPLNFEERDLARVHGQAYLDYQARVPKLLPLGGIKVAQPGPLQAKAQAAQSHS